MKSFLLLSLAAALFMLYRGSQVNQINRKIDDDFRALTEVQIECLQASSNDLIPSYAAAYSRCVVQ